MTEKAAVIAGQREPFGHFMTIGWPPDQNKPRKGCDIYEKFENVDILKVEVI